MPKVRTGCFTCKQRRVKCDEGKPACQNCERTGRRCEGYPPGPASTPAGDGSLDAQVQRCAQQIVVYNLPFKVPGSAADRQLLHFYTCEAAGGLSSFSDSTLWSKLVLQRSHHQPVVRHTLVALAALYRDYIEGGNRVQAPASHAAMQRIAKCHRQLRLYLRSADASADIALICSILFYAFETLLGDCSTATQHLDNGLRLLKRCQMQALAHSGRDELLAHLVPIFSRLDINASTFDNERRPILTLVCLAERLGPMHVVPSSLASLDEAENVATKLENWLMHYLIAHVAYKHKPVDEFPRCLVRERFALYQQFERFFFVFAALLESLPGEIPARALLLRVQTKMYYSLLLENIPNGSFGPCPPADSLRNTLADIEGFLSMESTQKSASTFTLSSQLVAILYFMCLKSTDVERRDTAFALLRHSSMPAKDGLWESEKAAAIVQTLIEQTKMCEPSRSLEETGGDVFSPEEDGLEHVFRNLNKRPGPSVLIKEPSTIDTPSESRQPSDRVVGFGVT
ncbi:Zn(II)2Cys6 transcription factor [Aspergillus nidulans FGSC A4]|uniref:Zn(II)2Cys6 transcription factor (Eurofung) n=1 Tax=Emericella nidulans (strain FGSC A4 / ATCC 38163 / CBS 112.46 / NRRL 194 / M139) TaxID=227321 RepID=C8V577_EMENI|nr:hypothetical protein [Aspergillus nidulans FGSC A4]CBF73568.1 TPA: Putative Zn(II)2Cys6 transcription factor (Eurofung) [Aspergillus nidulans FGSC A4]